MVGASPLRAVTAATAMLAALAAVGAGKANVSTSSQTGGSAHAVVLPSGQRLLLQTDSHGRVAIDALSSPASPVTTTYEIGSHRYFVPVVAVRYLGTLLDPSLFDVTALAGAETSTAGAVPVEVAWSGAKPPSMPWLQQTRSAGRGLIDGVITAASATRFMSALSADAMGGVQRISLLGSAPVPPPSPNFIMYTVTVKGIDATGHPDNGDFAIITNVDNGLKFTAFEVWYQGVFKISAPAGHYSAFSTFTTLTSQGMPTGLRIVVSNFSVTGAETVTVDARSATSTVSVSTPLPTSSGFGSVSWQRTDSAGMSLVSVGDTWQIGGGAPPFTVKTNHVPAPRQGTQGWIVSYHLESSPAIASPPYSYDLDFGSYGAIPRNEHFVATPSQLASIPTSYATDIPQRQTLEFRLAFFPWQFFSSATSTPFNAPLQRTEYVTALPVLVWMQNVTDSPMDFGGMFQDSPRVFQAGAQPAADWNSGPTGPGVEVDTGAAEGSLLCPACTEQGNLEFFVFPFGDNPPGHVGLPNFPGPGIAETDQFTLTRNGVQVTSGSDPLGVLIAVPPGNARYALSYDVSLHASWWTLSTTTSTTWTFLDPTGTNSPLPPGWVCASGTSTGCSVVALMIPDYQLPLSLTNTIAPGSVTWELGVQHILGVAIPLRQASVSVSFDGGHSWSAAQVHANSGGFAVSYVDPSGAATASLRIHVTDSAGGVLDQTIMNAYAIG